MSTTVPDTMPEDPEVLRATRQGRLCLIALILLILGLTGVLLFFILPHIKPSPGKLPAAESIRTMKIIFASLAGISISCAAIAVRQGLKILRNKQFPLPDAWVWRDTPVRRGPRAIKIAWLHILSGILSGIVCTALAANLWTRFDNFVPEYELPPGVTIVR